MTGSTDEEQMTGQRVRHQAVSEYAIKRTTTDEERAPPCGGEARAWWRARPDHHHLRSAGSHARRIGMNSARGF
ncbi:MAG: hypothetical protein WCK47_04405 [bacterium]